MPIEGTVLQMKSMNIDAVVNFPFPTAPDRIGLRKAESLLTHLGALEAMTATTMVRGVEKIGTAGGRITTIGTSMAAFPVTPRYAKMLVIGSQHGCLPYVIAMVAALSVGDPFLREESLNLRAGEGEEDEKEMEELMQDVPEFQHIRSGDMREKEERRAKRRAFYQAQQVILPVLISRDMFHLKLNYGIFRSATLLLGAEQATCSSSLPYWAHITIAMVIRNSLQRISFDLKYVLSQNQGKTSGCMLMRWTRL